MKIRKIVVCMSSLLVCGQIFSNSRSVEVLIDPPAPASITNIEYSLPPTGAEAVVPPELIREFLSDGENLRVTDLRNVTRNHPQIWNTVIADYSEFLDSINARGVLVTDNFKVFKWRLIAPNLLEISDFAPHRITFIYLSQPSHAVTIDEKSPKDFFLEQKQKQEQYKREQKHKELEEEAEARKTGIPRGLEPIEQDDDANPIPPRVE